jgi:hypothetical protein
MPSILRPRSGLATKVIGPNGVVESYAAGKKYVSRNIELPTGVTAQFDWLCDQVKRDTELYIAGDIRDGRGNMKTIINRRIHKHKDGWLPDLIDVPQLMFFIDIDGVLGCCDFREDPVAAVASVRDMVTALKGVACPFVGSSKAGMSELVRGKMFFTLATQTALAEIKAWAKDVNRETGLKIVDPSLYCAAQPVYLATPRFVDGMADPMPERVILLPGAERPIVLPRSLAPRTAIRRPATTGAGVAAGARAAGLSPKEQEQIARIKADVAARSPAWRELVDGMKHEEWDEPERWTLEGALAVVAAAQPGTRNDTFAGQAFTAGLRAKDLGLDRDATINDLIDAAGKADSVDTKTEGATAKSIDTITRCFDAGMARAEEDAAAAVAVQASGLSPAASAAKVSPTQMAALENAKRRLRAAFLIARLHGRRRIKGDLVRAALTVDDVTLRSKLMFALAAFLLKSSHAPEEIADAVVACGLPRSVGVSACRWAQRNVGGNPRGTVT